jgi:cytochrome c1
MLRLRYRVLSCLAACAVALAGGFVISACSDGSTPAVVVPGGSPDAGKEAILRHGCGSCHTIPGVKGADALVGPPLMKFGKRSYIAGELANTPENLMRWVQDPKGVEPGTDMPNLGVTADEARNIAAYLENLR